MDVNIVDSSNIWIRYDDEGEVAESMYAMSEAIWKDGERKIRRGEQVGFRERWVAMSRVCDQSRRPERIWKQLTGQDLPESGGEEALRPGGRRSHCRWSQVLGMGSIGSRAALKLWLLRKVSLDA